MRDGVAIYDFHDADEAKLARDALDDAGFEAWLEEGEPFGEGLRRHVLVVPYEEAEAARTALTEPLPELPEDDLDAPGSERRSIWVPAVAALVLIGVVVASVDAFLWPWILLTALVGFLVWRAAGPRRP